MHEDPDTRLQLRGSEALDDAELLSFLLTRGGAPGPAALQTARWALESAGSLARLRSLGEAQLRAVPGIGPFRARRIAALLELARRLAERPIPRGRVCSSPREVYESLRGSLGRAQREAFLVLLLDGRLRKIGQVEICKGGRSSVSVLPSDVFDPALREGAQSLVLVHNHPSGDPTPSPEDLAITERLCVAGELVGIGVRDHVIVADGRFVSFAEHGLLPRRAPQQPDSGYTEPP